jgi:hypothetical protein
MATAPVSSSSIYQELQTYFQGRNADLQKLGQALQSGDLAAAEQEYQAIQNMGESGPFANGDPFQNSLREKAFESIGQALQSGDLGAALHAFARLKSSFERPHRMSSPELGSPSTPVASSTGQPVAAAANDVTSGPEVILNLGNVTPGEQITIGLTDAQNGGEQLTISVARPQDQTPGQITLNLGQNANPEIVLNFFNPPASGQTGSVNLSA